MIAAELLTRLGFVVDPKGIDKGKSALQEFKTWAIRLGIGAALAMVGRTAIRAASEMEGLTAQFTTMLKSGIAAKNLMAQIQGYAARTTFETGDIAGMMSTLMQFGLGQKQAWDVMKRLGDVAGSNKERFQSLGLAMAQVASAGKLQGQDLLQLVNAGWNPLKTISEKTGKSMADLRKEMEKGQISYEMVEQALRDVTNAGGLFFENQKKQSRTLAGLYSTMIDNLKIALGNMALAFSPVIKSMMDAVGQLDLNPLVNAFRWLAQAIQYVATIAWNSGLAEAFFVFQESLGDLMGTFADQTQPKKFGDILLTLGRLLGWVASAVLLAISTIIRLQAWVTEVVAWMWKWKEGLAAVGIVLALIFGPGMIAQVGQFSLALKFATFWQTLFARAALASGRAAGYQLTMLGFLKAAAFGVGQAFTVARNALATFGATAAGMLGLVAASIGIVLYDLYLLRKTLREVKDLEDSQAREEKKAKIADQILEATKEWRKARDRGDTETMERMSYQIRERRKAYADLGAEARKGAEGELPSFENFIKVQDEQAKATMEKTVQETNKTQNITSNTAVTINAPTGSDGNTGLSASELGRMAQNIFRSQFSIELRRVLVEGA